MTSPEEMKHLELTQLVVDLKAVQSPVLYTQAGFTMVAEALYERGVRTRLSLGGVCGRCSAEGREQVPAVGTSPRGWKRCATCLYNDGHDDAITGWYGEAGGYREPAPFPEPDECPRCSPGSPCRYHKSSVVQMSEVPGHVQPLARTRMREFVGAEILVREDPDWGRASQLAKIRWDGVSGYVVLPPEVSLVQGQLPMTMKLNRVYDGDGPMRAEYTLRHLDGRREKTHLTQVEIKTYLRHGWTKGPSGGVLYAPGDRIEKDVPESFECPHCGQRFTALENGTDGKPRIPFHKVLFMTDTMECPGSRERLEKDVPDRELPEGVQRVIQFVQLADAVTDWHVHLSGHGQRRTLTREDLKAVLAEIPDAAPRYPTIWAYEQACRTIRERDARIEKALELLEHVHIGGTAVTVLDEIRWALRLRTPRAEPATEAVKSEVARALEIAAARDEHMVAIPNRDWISATRALAAEVEHLRTLGDTLAADIDEQPRCPRCEHLVNQHHEDGCWFTVSNGTEGEALNCPCTFDARGATQEAHGE